MLGLRFRTDHPTLALALLAGSKAGCAEAAKPNQLGFEFEADRVESSLLRVRVDGCDADAETLYGASCDDCTEGQDCSSIDPPNGTWDDDFRTSTLGYICETP